MSLSAERERAPLSRLRLAGRFVIVVLLVAGIVAVWLNRAALDPNTIRAAIEAHPAIAPLLFLALHILASLLFIPRTVMGLVAGGVFDFWWGLVWAATGSVLGAIAGFLIARYVNSGMIDLESLPKLGPVLQRAEAGGWRAVTMLRLIPVIPHSFSNYALGLTRLSLGGYALG
ncbi:MAG TPA: VTT domain-containing protein, partial [Stellaceae bacterium]|nr:VTT domain-containing protein [Stellaceae bacterium]